MPDENKKLLTDAERQRLAERAIEDDLAASRPVDHPRAVLTGGQPGSGKSQIVAAISFQFEVSGEGAVIVDPDEIRPTLPYMRERIAAGNLDTPDAANSDAGTIAYKMVQIAKSKRRNLLIDGTLQNTSRAVDLADELHFAGYSVEMHGMAVSPDLSHARTYARREAQIASSSSGFGRGVGDEFHDQAVAGFAETVTAYQTRYKVDAMALYDDQGAKIAETRLIDGHWEPPLSMATALADARQNPSPEVLQTTFETWTLARDLMAARNADGAELAKVTDYADQAKDAATAKPSLPRAPDDNGSYTGAIVRVDAATATQMVDGNEVVHQRRALIDRKGLVAEGRTVAIDYKAGVAKVGDPHQQRRGRSV